MQANKHDDKSKIGFLKLMRSPESLELLRDLLAFGLLALIAFRTRWRFAFSADGLEIGEALIGDYKHIGLSRQQYRTRIARLVKWGFITVRPTPKGTIAKLTSTAVFDINLPPPNERLTNKNQPSEQPSNSRVKSALCQPSTQPTSNQQPTNSQPLTKKERRKESKKEERAAAAVGSTTLLLDKEISRLAATASTKKEFKALIGKLQKRYPKIHVRDEYDRCFDHYEEKNRVATGVSLVDWVSKARPPLPRQDDLEEDYDSDKE